MDRLTPTRLGARRLPPQRGRRPGAAAGDGERGGGQLVERVLVEAGEGLKRRQRLARLEQVGVEAQLGRAVLKARRRRRAQTVRQVGKKVLELFKVERAAAVSVGISKGLLHVFGVWVRAQSLERLPDLPQAQLAAAVGVQPPEDPLRRLL